MVIGDANGVAAQSIGGGGGNGGLSVAGTFNFASQNNVPSFTASLGGFGGSGGAGGKVDVTRTGATTTVGNWSSGIFAQSLGGGGGNGGLSVAGSIGGPDAKQISASVGGFGGSGSGAGDVTVTNTGAITTGSITMQQEQLALPGTVLVTVPVVTGYSSDGILAQSIGGGGGNGGFAFSGTIGPTGENMNLNVGLTVGGFGGSGGVGGNVNVTNVGMIDTYGANANGIYAQSVGGGGGKGGSALTGLIAAGNAQSGGNAVNVAVSVGGFGGNGNVAGNVTVDQTGGILTAGPGSDGILAQSIGGGGGTGGGANTVSLQLATSCTFTFPLQTQLGLPSIKGCNAPKTPSVDVEANVGGFGGTGNDGGGVTVTNNSSIKTLGDSSSGIVAQSIGGGGGNGGQAMVGLTGLFPGASYVSVPLSIITLPISTTGTVEGLFRFTVGGFGGAAGKGAAVTVTNKGDIQTSGASAYGIEAQSIGGGGGSGGNASSGFTGAASVGGFGMASGNGGEVTVTNTAGAKIATTGQSADAIFAQSVGGGGGDGGTAGGVAALGGFGGASGSGRKVSVENDGALQTSGDNSIGIFAQSVGGGGGNGGGTGLSGIAVGGPAGALGSTGDGGEVMVDNTAAATIVTTGAGADGIEAQSIGGGGGNGGGSTVLAAVTVGGQGGSSGAGSEVQIFNEGMIETKGHDAIGVFGQSVGGSGGSGGGSIVSLVSVGGSGGSAGAGGEVDITNTGDVFTLGAGSDAIRGQSVGGGGGSAEGIGPSTPQGGLGLGLLVSVGGGKFGGGGGDGGTVAIRNSGTLMTMGDNANGIYAQSVGGGGGDGGRAIGLVAVGGKGGATGNGGAVTVTNGSRGQIVTQGIMSNGIFAQSVGGGGGNGGGAYSGLLIDVSTSVGGSGRGGGNGDKVTVDNFGQIQTNGSSSQAIFAQSVGGGGGNGTIAGSFNLSAFVAAAVSVGGSGGRGGNGGAVTVTNHNSGSIFTNGINSTAIFAQSVGGGGGNGGFAIGVSAAPTGSATVALGGSGGAAGNGDKVNVTNDGAITINGANSIGILAQSVGGGGGTAGSASGAAVIPVSIGGQSGAIGHGGDVTVTNTGSITIAGDNSIGIFAQSVGGGGGLVLPGGGATSITTNSGGSGNGGTVTTTNTGSIVVTGKNSVAFYSQSVAGGGGAVGLGADPPGQIGAFLFSGSAGGQGAAGANIISQTGNLIASGDNSIALVAQSDAPGGNGDITVNILNASTKTPSLIEGGSAQGAGVLILGGANNQVNNAGIITTVLGIDGFAIRGTTGNNHVDNKGMVVGSVALGNGANSFLNEQNAVFEPGVTVDLGVGNTLTNEGVLAPGGLQRVITTNLNGNFVQTATGVTNVKLDLGTNTIDNLNITGSASLAGTLNLSLLNPQLIQSGKFSETFISAAGGVTNNGMVLNALPSAVITYDLLYPNSKTAKIDYSVEFAAKGLSPNLIEVGKYFDRIQAAGSSPALANTVTRLVYEPTLPAYRQALQQLTPDFYGELQSDLIDSSERFALMLTEGGAMQYVLKQGLVWLDFGYVDLRHSGYGDYKSVNQIGRREAAGFHLRFGRNWTTGLGWSRQENSAAGNGSFWSATGATEWLGGMLSHQFGSRMIVSGTLSYGWNSRFSRRTSDLFAPVTANLNSGPGSFGATARVSYMLRHGGWYLKPSLDLGLTDLLANPATESGGSPTALALTGYQDTHLWVRPAGEAGHVFTLAGGKSLRPYLKLGNLSYLNGHETYVHATFAGAPRAASPMAVPVDLPSPFEGTAGVELTFLHSASMGVEYSNSYANHYNINRLNAFGFLRIQF